MYEERRELAGLIGRAVRERRIVQGLTQADTADRIGISVEFLGRVERGKALPGVRVLARIAQTLGLSVDDALSDARPLPEDSPEFQRTARRLRRASPRVVDLVDRLLQISRRH